MAAMQKFNLDADSDDEQMTSQKDLEPNTNIFELKSLTMDLLNPDWKQSRIRELVKKLLDLEEPSITSKMVDFLMHDAVCETLIGFVTLCGVVKSRPTPNDSNMGFLKQAHNATNLLAPKDPSDSLNQFLSKKTTLISRLLFDIFKDNSCGSFHHVYKIFEYLIRFFPQETLEGMCADGKGVQRVESMLRYIGYAPVNEIMVLFISLTTVPRNSATFNNLAATRNKLFEGLREWMFMSKLVDAICKPEKVCNCSSYVEGHDHASSAFQLLQDLVDNLSVEDVGEMILQPFGHQTSILDNLLECAANTKIHEVTRFSACRTLSYLLRKAAEPDVMFIVNTAPGAPPQQNFIPNRLHPLRERIVLHIESKMSLILDAIQRYSTQPATRSEKAVVKYPGHKVKEPFTALRGGLFEVLVLMVESDEAVAGMISETLWKALMEWTITYGFNNVYHALFYRLVFSVLRQAQDPALKNLFQKAKLIEYFVSNYHPFPVEERQVPPKRADDLILNRNAARGLLLNCMNAIRLQASSQLPQTFLRQHLASNAQWQAFSAQLMADTRIQQRFGMGIRVLDLTNNKSPIPTVISDGKTDEGCDHGSRFARSLGFQGTSPHDS